VQGDGGREGQPERFVVDEARPDGQPLGQVVQGNTEAHHHSQPQEPH